MTDTIPLGWFFLFPFMLTALALLANLAAKRRTRRAEQVAQVKLRLQGLSLPVQAMAALERRTLWDAMQQALLPRSYFPTDPEEVRPQLRIDVYTRLDLADRLRLLLTGDLRLLATVYTNVEVREARTLVNLEIHPFKIAPSGKE